MRDNDMIVGVVDDSDMDFALFTRAFGGSSQLRRWASGEAALSDFVADPARLTELAILVVDLNLIGITGVEVVERVRELPEGKTLPLCVLTDSRREQDRRQALDVGATAFLVKPNDAARLKQLPELLGQLAAKRRPRDV